MDILDKQTVASLRLLHAGFNLAVLLLFVYQASLGLLIRKARITGVPSSGAVKRHRKIGPVAASSGIAGYVAGILLVLVDEGRVFKYPLHFLTGSLIVASILLTVAVAGRMTAREPLWRSRHLNLGRLILFLYGLQAFLGAGILF